MRAIFSIFKLLIFGIWSFISIILGAVLFVFRKKNGMEWVAKYFWSPVVLPLLQVDITIKNIEKIDPLKSYLIMANHNSFIDIPILFKSLPFYSYFIAKKELKKIPLLGWYIKTYGMIFVDRSDIKKSKASLKKAANLISNGKRIIIFPEGTKSRDGKIANFKKGGFHLAKQAAVPILPIKIEGARHVWPNNKPFQLAKGKIIVKIGDPIQHDFLNTMPIKDQAIHLKKTIEKL